MNWNSVILVGTIAITAVWWFAHASKNYPGPKVMALYIHSDSTGTDSDVNMGGKFH
jgi:choline transport protein